MSEYVVVSMEALEDMFVSIYDACGSIFSVALYLGVLIMSIYVIIKIIKTFSISSIDRRK